LYGRTAEKVRSSPSSPRAESGFGRARFRRGKTGTNRDDLQNAAAARTCRQIGVNRFVNRLINVSESVISGGNWNSGTSLPGVFHKRIPIPRSWDNFVRAARYIEMPGADRFAAILICRGAREGNCSQRDAASS